MDGGGPAEKDGVTADRPPPPAGDDRLRTLLAYAVERGASDLHLKVPARPVVRINGSLEPIPDLPALAAADTQRFADELLAGHDTKRAEFEENGETDLSHSREGLGRFRVNIFRQRGSVSIVLRVVPFRVLSVDDLQLPPVVSRLAEQEHDGYVQCAAAATAVHALATAMVPMLRRRPISCRAGRMKAAVLPVPVCAQPRMSRPVRARGMACS